MRHKFFDKKKIILAHFIGFFQFLSNNDEQVTNRKKNPNMYHPRWVMSLLYLISPPLTSISPPHILKDLITGLVHDNSKWVIICGK